MLICRARTQLNYKRVEFHLYDLAGTIGADVMICDRTAPPYFESGWDVATSPGECEGAKHALNGAIATTVPLVMTTLGKLGPSAGDSCRV